MEVAMADDDKNLSFRQAVLKQLKRWAEMDPNQAVLGSADKGEALTRRDVYTHVSRNTQLGNQLMKGWEEVAAEYVLGSSFDNHHHT
jgi:hypothetical protein